MTTIPPSDTPIPEADDLLTLFDFVVLHSTRLFKYKEYMERKYGKMEQLQYLEEWIESFEIFCDHILPDLEEDQKE